MSDSPLHCSDLLSGCLHFTAHAVAREVDRLADEAFRPTGLCPSGALLLAMVVERPGINPSEAAQALHLAPSSVTRFADGLQRKSMITRTQEGRNVILHATPKGLEALEQVREAWRQLMERITTILGPERTTRLAGELAEVARALGQG